MQSTDPWLGLAIGNSRLHWAWFDGDRLCQQWDTPHFSPAAIAHLMAGSSDRTDHSIPAALRSLFHQPVELWLASVVPEQTARWQKNVPVYQTVTLEQVPIEGLYATLGIDRALALWGAMCQRQAPTLVIDAGTALTVTAADRQGRLVGGAILPGLQLQWRSLCQNTAALPFVESATLPPRWALSTADAIRSGVVYTAIAGLRDYITAWLEEFPGSAIAITGGDGAFLHEHLTTLHPDLAAVMTLDPHLVFWGMRSVRDRTIQNGRGERSRPAYTESLF